MTPRSLARAAFAVMTAAWHAAAWSIYTGQPDDVKLAIVLLTVYWTVITLIAAVLSAHA